MPQHPVSADREAMPVSIVLTFVLSGAFIAVWGARAFFVLREIPAAPAATIVWSATIAIGLLVNLAIIIGLVRRADWARWLVVSQALVITVVLAAAATSFGVWGILAVAIQSVLVVVPTSNRWFRDGRLRGMRESRSRVVGR